jgi:hypothetical protein
MEEPLFVKCGRPRKVFRSQQGWELVMGKGYTTLEELRRRYKLVRVLQNKPHDMERPARPPPFYYYYDAKIKGQEGSQARLVPAKNPNKLRLLPIVPESAMDGEDVKTPRIVVAPDIHGAIAGVFGQPPHPDFTQNVVSEPGSSYHVLGLRKEPKHFVPHTKLRNKVPDARITKEGWLTKPTRMEYAGKLQVGPDEQVYVSKVSLKELHKRIRAKGIKKSESLDELVERLKAEGVI